MLIENVKQLSSMGRLLYWIRERESIRKQRESGKPYPWTDDTILQTYRFCNVRRMDDTVSKWLFDNWYNPHFDDRNMVTAVALARFLNNIPTLEYLKYPFTYSPVDVVRRLRKRRDEGHNTFAAAYVVRGNDGEDKIDSVVNYYVAAARRDHSPWLDTSSMENSVTGLKECFGFGSFMAGQVVADLRWAIKGTWADRMSWAAKGPGSARGINRLLLKPLNKPMTQEQFMVGLNFVMKICKKRLTTSITARLEAHDYQSCLCEYDKYSRTLIDERRPKQIFRSRT